MAATLEAALRFFASHYDMAHVDEMGGVEL